MPYTIAITLIRNAPTFPLSDAKKELRRIGDGDITGVYPVRVYPDLAAYQADNFTPVQGGEIPAYTFGSNYIPCEVISDNRASLLFITGIPDSIDIARLKNLTQSHEDYSADTQTITAPAVVFDDEIAIDGRGGLYVDVLEQSRDANKVTFSCRVLEIRRRHNFRIRPADMPQPVKNALQADNYYTVSFTQARNYIRNRKANRMLDEEQDI